MILVFKKTKTHNSLSVSLSLDPRPNKGSETRNQQLMSTEDPDPIPMKKEAASASVPALPPVSSPPSSQGSVAPQETLAPPNSMAAAADNRTFSQLLAGAMGSPVGSPRGAPIVAVPVVAVPCFLAPATILESPGFAGQFAMTHQAVLATVTAQAQMQLQAAYPSSSETSANSYSQPVHISPVPLQQRPSPLSEGSVSTPVSTESPPSEQKSQSTQIIVKTSSDDGYNWRKYGQKQVKSSDRSRSYYRCTNVNCFAKKKVERCPDGRETEIIFRGQHNHEPPQRTKYQKEKVVRTPTADNEILDLPRNEVNESDLLTSKPEHNSGNETPEQQLYCSSDCEGDAAVKTEEEHGDEPDLKRRFTESTTPYSAPVLKTIKEPKIVVQSACDTTSISDGYKWRKYGQKLVKGNPNPRSYYRCTYNGCPVRKHVERASDDAKSVLITYEGKHNHEQPSPKNGADPPSTTLLLTAAPDAETSKDEQLQTSESSLNKKTSTGGELGRDKVSLESAETLLSMGFNSSSGEETNGASSDGINRPQFNENRAAVPVQNS